NHSKFCKCRWYHKRHALGLARTRQKIPLFCPGVDTPGVFYHPGTGQLGRLPMISTASGRSAFIVAAGLFVLLANPVTAANDADASAQDSKTTAVTHRTVRHA